MSARLAVVTDSTASLPEDVAAGHGITVVPLQVVIGAEVHDEGEEGATPEAVATALRDYVPVSTSRPAPARILDAYERLAAEGCEGIVSVHLSADMSGTVESAQLAARRAPVPVEVVDARQVGVGTGYAALAAAEAIRDGADLVAAAEAARLRAEASTTLCYVDTLEYLRRGGRIGAAAALLGGALAVKPLLRITDGRVETLDKLRTTSRALARLEDLAVEAAGEERVDVTVAHLANPDRAATLVEHLSERLEAQLASPVDCGELGAVLGAHVGPGMLAVCVSPRVDDDA